MVPECGRAVLFQSSELHLVQPLLSVCVVALVACHVITSRMQGRRYALAQWMTLDPSKENNLDHQLQILDAAFGRQAV